MSNMPNINRLALQGAVWIALLTCIAMLALTHDLLRSLTTEIDEWDQYRSYGLVRTLGVELTQAWEDRGSAGAEPDYQALLDQLWQSHPDLGDLALLDPSFNELAIMGKHKPTLRQLLKKNTLLVNLAHDRLNYDNNVRIQSLHLVGTDLRNVQYRYGAIYIPLLGGQPVYLVVGFTPLLFSLPPYFMYVVPVVLSLLLGCIGWQIIRYYLKRHYLEPVTHLNRLGLQLGSGCWPMQAAASDRVNSSTSNPVLALASDALRRSHAAWQFWQWQIQRARSVVPDLDATLDIPTLAPSQTAPAPAFVSYAGIELGLFLLATSAGVAALAFPNLLEWWSMVAVAGAVFSLSVVAPSHARGALVLSTLVGLAVGVVAGVLILQQQPDGLQINQVSTAGLILLMIVAWLVLFRAIWLRRKGY